MGFTAGSGPELRDTLTGAVAAPSWGFPTGSAGHILNPSQKQVALGTNEIIPF